MASPNPSVAQPPVPDGSGEIFECARAFLGMARELATASSVCMSLEGNVSHLISHYTGEDRTLLIRELQHLDTLNQMLVSLSSYASVLGAQCIAGHALNIEAASNEMGLARVAARLREVDARSHRPGDIEPGEMDLF